MTTIKDFIARHTVPTYFVLTFVVSWGGVLTVIGGQHPENTLGNRPAWQTI